MSNQAAFLLEPNVPLKVDTAPLYEPGPDEIVIKVLAVAIAPMEAMIQKTGMLLDGLPAILGADGAGEVHAVGSNVKNFVPGDRVMAQFDGVPAFPTTNYHRSSFQKYAVAKARMVAKIPDSISFTEAVVMPLAITTAADSLFSDHGMDLPDPKFQAQATPKGESVVVWGGSSSVGTAMIQMLALEGYEVIAVAGSKNHELCKSLGAKHVFDHSSASVVDDIASALQGASVAGVVTSIMTKEAQDKVVEIYLKLGSQGKLGSVFPPGMPLPSEVPEGVDIRLCHGSFMSTSELGALTWGEWVPAALKSGGLKMSPPPLIFGKGLESIQGAIDRYHQGVSGQKIVVDLS